MENHDLRIQIDRPACTSDPPHSTEHSGLEHTLDLDGPIAFPFGGPVVQHDRSRVNYKIAAGCFSRISIGFRGPVLQRYSTSDANLIPVTLCVRRILARPALLALRRAFIHAMRLLLTSVGYKSNRHGCP